MFNRKLEERINKLSREVESKSERIYDLECEFNIIKRDLWNLNNPNGELIQNSGWLCLRFDLIQPMIDICLLGTDNINELKSEKKSNGLYIITVDDKRYIVNNGKAIEVDKDMKVLI